MTLALALTDAHGPDPTGTAGIRRSFRAAGKMRMNMFRSAMRQAVVEHDVLGLGGAGLSMQPPETRLQAFNGWARVAAGRALDGPWLSEWISRAWASGEATGALQARSQAPGEGSGAWSELAKVELDAIAFAVVQVITREAAVALTKRRANKVMVWRRMAKAFDKVGPPRIMALANTFCVACHNRGRLAAYRAAGITKVGVIPERLLPKQALLLPGGLGDRLTHDEVHKGYRELGPARPEWELKNVEEPIKIGVRTAGDEFVCQACEEFAAGSPYDIDEVEDTLPMHVSCRCTWYPWDDQRFSHDAVPKQSEREAMLERLMRRRHRALARMAPRKFRPPWRRWDDEFDPSQPRDPDGQWTGGAGGSGEGAAELLEVAPQQITIKRGENKQGEQIALVRGSSAVAVPHPKGEVYGYVPKYRPSHKVIIRTGNYSGQVHGGMRYSWKVIKADLTLPEAEKLFARRTKGGKVHDAFEDEFDPSQPRDPDGKWTGAGGGSAGGDGHPGKGYSASARTIKGVIHTDNVHDAQRALFENRKVELSQLKQVSTLVDLLGETAAKMEAAGEQAPLFNLCNVSITGTNLFCAESKGIPRVEMPVIRAKKTKEFVKYLKSRGYKTEKSTERADHLRSTQDQIDGAKVAANMKRIDKEGFYKRIVVSRDDYILDGHHTWAGQLGVDARDGSLKGDKTVRITRVDISITKLLAEAETWTGGAGKKAAGQDAWDPSQPRDPDGKWSGGGSVASLSDLERLSKSALPPDTEGAHHYYHSPRSAAELESIAQTGLRPDAFLSKDEIRDRGAGYVVVRMDKPLPESKDVVEVGLSYRQWRSAAAIPAANIVRVVGTIPMGGGGHSIREDELAEYALKNQGRDDDDVRSLPEKYRKWFKLSGAKDAWNPFQPREPAGSPEGGQFASITGGGISGGATGGPVGAKKPVWKPSSSTANHRERVEKILNTSALRNSRFRYQVGKLMDEAKTYATTYTALGSISTDDAITRLKGKIGESFWQQAALKIQKAGGQTAETKKMIQQANAHGYYPPVEQANAIASLLTQTGSVTVKAKATGVAQPAFTPPEPKAEGWTTGPYSTAAPEPTATIPVATPAWTKLGPQKGSVAGGMYGDPQGNTWYIKTPKTEQHVNADMLANSLYKLAGVNVAHQVKTKLDGKPAVASLFVQNTDTLAGQAGEAKQNAQKMLREDFAVDAWLGNRDVIGLEQDNVLVSPGSGVTRIDFGASLMYRAQGETKEFGKIVGEISSMRLASVNPQTASVFGSMTDAEVSASIDKVLAINNVTIIQMVKAHGFSVDLADTLIKRKEWLANYQKEVLSIIPSSEVSAPQPAQPTWETKLEQQKAAMQPQATAAELEKAKKVGPYYPAPTSEMGKAAVKAFNEKWATKTPEPHELEQKVAEYKQAKIALGFAEEQEAEEQSASIKATKAAAKAKAEAESAKHQAAIEEIAAELGLSPNDADQVDTLISLAGGNKAAIVAKFKEFQKSGIGKHGLPLTPFQSAMIQSYVGSAYGSANRQLREGAWDMKTHVFAAAIQKALTKLPGYNNTLQRGFTAKEPEQIKYEVGKIVHWNAFSSCGKKSSFTGNMQCTITPLAGDNTRARDLGPMNPNEAGGEVLYMAHSSFKVTSVKGSPGGTMHVHLQEVETF